MLCVNACGKINWTLDILGKFPNGYHHMDMLMQPVSLADQLFFSEDESLQLTGVLHCPSGTPNTPSLAPSELTFDEKNLVYRSACLLKQKYGISKGAKIHIIKNIPFGAGMGGGSADAAAALLGLNRLWNIGLTSKELSKLGLSLGADIPFMLHGGYARVSQTGEQIEPLHPAPNCTLILVRPCEGISTPKAFLEYDQNPPSFCRPKQDEAQAALQKEDFRALRECGGNVFQPIVALTVPGIEKAVEKLYSVGADYASMTGSGCVVFGAFPDYGKAEAAKKSLQAEYPHIWLERTVSNGITITDKGVSI